MRIAEILFEIKFLFFSFAIRIAGCGLQKGKEKNTQKYTFMLSAIHIADCENSIKITLATLLTRNSQILADCEIRNSNNFHMINNFIPHSTTRIADCGNHKILSFSGLFTSAFCFFSLISTVHFCKIYDSDLFFRWALVYLIHSNLPWELTICTCFFTASEIFTEHFSCSSSQILT